MYIFWDKQPTVDVDHVHELDHDVAHEEGDGEEGEEAGVAGLAPHNHLGNRSLIFNNSIILTLGLTGPQRPTLQ